MNDLELLARLFTEGKLTKDEFLQLVKAINKEVKVEIKENPDQKPATPIIPWDNENPYIRRTNPYDWPWNHNYPVVSYSVNANAAPGFPWMITHTL